MLALAVDGRPRTLTLKEMLEEFLAYREEVIRRRTELPAARGDARAHVLEGLVVAVATSTR